MSLVIISSFYVLAQKSRHVGIYLVSQEWAFFRHILFGVFAGVIIQCSSPWFMSSPFFQVCKLYIAGFWYRMHTHASFQVTFGEIADYLAAQMLPPGIPPPHTRLHGMLACVGSMRGRMSGISPAQFSSCFEVGVAPHIQGQDGPRLNL